MENKTLLIGVIAAIIILLVIGGVYYFKGNKSSEGTQGQSGELSSQGPEVSLGIQKSQIAINSLNKTGCSELENNTEENNCLKAIDIIQKAITQKDRQICFKEIQNAGLTAICLLKMDEEVRKNGI